MQIEKKLDKPLFKVLETIQDNIVYNGACVAVNDPNRSPAGDFITATLALTR